MSKPSSQDYVMKFGQYKGMKAVDVASLTKQKTNKKGEEYTEETGKKYLKFLIDQSWFHDKDKDILKDILGIKKE